MSRFFVGQRVRIVLGELSGVETKIIADVVSFGLGPAWELGVPATWADGEPARVLKVNAGKYLIPILDQHQPCEADFKESLDRLAHEGVKVELTAYLIGIGENVK